MCKERDKKGEKREMRKKILIITAVAGALLTFMQAEFGLSIDPFAVTAGMTAVIVYLFGEGRNDLARIKRGIVQEGRFKDPNFWIAFISAVLPVVNTELKLDLPVELIVTAASGIIAFIFAKRNKEISAVQGV